MYRLRSILRVVLVVLFWPAPGFCVIGPILITQSRVEPVKESLPVHMTVLTAEDIAHSGARTVPELLASLSGVYVRSFYGHGARVSVDMRGFGATGTQNSLILLDGRRLNDVDLAAVDFAAIALDQIERIEVIRGSGAVLYGEGAVGGAVNIITKAPAKAPFKGRAKAVWGSYAAEQFDVSWSQSVEHWSYAFHFSQFDSEGYRENNALQQDVMGFALYRQVGIHTWAFKLDRDEQALGLPGARRVDPSQGINELADDRRGTSTPDDFADQQGDSAALSYQRAGHDMTSFAVEVGVRDKEQQTFSVLGGMTNFVDTRLKTHWLTPRWSWQQALFGGMGQTTLGLDYYRSDYRSNRAFDAMDDAHPAHRLLIEQESLALYVQDNIVLGDRTWLNWGGRIQRVSQQGKDKFDATAPGAAFDNQAPDYRRHDTEPMLEFGIRHQLLSGLSIFGRLTRSVRFSTVDELFEFDPQTFLRVFSPLEPQQGHSLDFGLEAQGHKLALGAELYYAEYRNEIHFNPVSFTNDNLAPTRRYGVSVDLGMALMEHLSLDVAYGLTRSTFASGEFKGNDVPLVPEHTLNMKIFWKPSKTVSLGVTSNYVSRTRFENDEANRFQKIPDYMITDLRLKQMLGQFEWNISINNIFDEKAFNNGVRSTFTPGVFVAYPLPERNVMVSIGAKW